MGSLYVDGNFPAVCVKLMAHDQAFGIGAVARVADP